LSSHFHAFGSEAGVTGVVLLAESHISIHTWPEFGFAAVDIFMCGQAEPQRALDVMQGAFEPKTSSVKSLARGVVHRMQTKSLTV
jgi:S-adenosylmethionine decarboxylase